MKDKMILLADLGRVKAYRLHHDPRNSTPQVELVDDFEFLESHERMRLRVSDQAGHLPGTGNGEDHNLQLETERRLVKEAADKICALVQGKGAWYLAAPGKINARLVECLSPEARASLAKNVQADLVKTSPEKLPGHFLDGQPSGELLAR